MIQKRIEPKSLKMWIRYCDRTLNYSQIGQNSQEKVLTLYNSEIPFQCQIYKAPSGIFKEGPLSYLFLSPNFPLKNFPIPKLLQSFFPLFQKFRHVEFMIITITYTFWTFPLYCWGERCKKVDNFSNKSSVMDLEGRRFEGKSFQSQNHWWKYLMLDIV